MELIQIAFGVSLILNIILLVFAGLQGTAISKLLKHINESDKPEEEYKNPNQTQLNLFEDEESHH